MEGYAFVELVQESLQTILLRLVQVKQIVGGAIVLGYDEGQLGWYERHGFGRIKSCIVNLAGVVEAMPRLTKPSCLWLIHIWTAAIHKWDGCVHPLGTDVTTVMVWSVYN